MSGPSRAQNSTLRSNPDNLTIDPLVRGGLRRRVWQTAETQAGPETAEDSMIASAYSAVTLPVGEVDAGIIEPIVGLPGGTRREYSIVLQEWEGSVECVDADSFTARLVDLTSNDADEEAEFAIEDVSEGDRDLLQPGAIFYWSIGYRESPSGQVSRQSVIRFRRLPSWSKSEIEEAQRRAVSVTKALSD